MLLTQKMMRSNCLKGQQRSAQGSALGTLRAQPFLLRCSTQASLWAERGAFERRILPTYFLNITKPYPFPRQRVFLPSPPSVGGRHSCLPARALYPIVNAQRGKCPFQPIFLPLRKWTEMDSLLSEKKHYLCRRYAFYTQIMSTNNQYL